MTHEQKQNYHRDLVNESLEKNNSKIKSMVESLSKNAKVNDFKTDLQYAKSLEFGNITNTSPAIQIK